MGHGHEIFVYLAFLQIFKLLFNLHILQNTDF